MQTMKGLIKEIAGWYGVGDEVVKREMELAIMEAFTTPQNEEVSKLQSRIPRRGKYLPWRNSCFTSYRKFKMKRMKRMADRNVDSIKMNYFETMMAKEYSIRYSRCIISAGMVCCLHGLAVSWQLLQ